jgi:L-methionine (R)-S-oxide reductase
MAEELFVPNTTDREAIYISLIPQIKALLEGESDFIANTANIVAAIHHSFNFHWTGCYFVKDEQLVLGPFQGPIACTRIQKGKGVCGTSWLKRETIIVPDVDLFPGHIACSSLSKSEIVVPIFNKTKEVLGVLDVDSKSFNDFSKIDANFLQQIAAILASKYIG